MATKFIQTSGDYGQLLTEAIRLRKQHETRAKDFVPRMYAILVEGEDLTPQDAADRIYKDLARIWEKDTIRRLLPPDAKNQSARERQVLSRSHNVSEAGSILQTENDNAKVVAHLEQQNAKLRGMIQALQEEKKMLVERTLRLERILVEQSPHGNSHNKRKAVQNSDTAIIMPPHLFMKAFTLMRSSTKPLVLKVAAEEVVDVDKLVSA